MSMKSLDSFASAELAEDALETVSGGAKGDTRAVAVQRTKSPKEMQGAMKQMNAKTDAVSMQQSVSKTKY